MYMIFPFILLLTFLFVLLNHHRKKKLIHHICCMSCEEKCRTLDALIQPFGFSYLPCKDLFTSNLDAWQREFGYQTLYDRNAAHFGIVLDSLPVYFDYDGRTWLMEFWKGQYGINLGGEIGLYRADQIVAPNRRERTLFSSVTNPEMLLCTLEILENNRPVFQLTRRHWWLTGFRMGRFTSPDKLTLHASVTFANYPMMQSFIRGLLETGCSERDIRICGLTVSFSFCGRKHPAATCLDSLKIHFAQRRNLLLCRLYLFVTRPFCCTLDKMLYLYGYLPFAFRKTAGICRRKFPEDNRCRKRTLRREGICRRKFPEKNRRRKRTLRREGIWK